MNHRYLDTSPMDISDDDILKAMKSIHGYLDITPGDFKEIYRFAYRHALDRLAHSVTAGEVMTTDVVFVKRGDPLETAAQIMARYGIAGLPVVENGEKVVGVISEKDFLFHMGGKDARSFMEVVVQCLRNKGCVAISMRQKKAEDIMTSPAITVREDTPVSEIANIFMEKEINRVPVIDDGGKLLGIVAREDIVKSSFPQNLNR
ncbi:MAG: CBS domain-containing protein [Deltaproteobacteria bacterium]|nr:CBS domain-containing protein [Deltaproteobacteria bacterium]